MTPTPESSPADLAALRRQLILAQVQLMELEDTRDDLQTRLAAAHDLLAQAQRLGDQALQERTRSETELRNLQTELAAAQGREAALRLELAAADKRETALAARADAVERARQSLQAETAERAARITQLETERQTMKSSRSWRYTAPLRSLERWLRRGEPSA